MVIWQLILYTLSAWMYYSALSMGFGLVLRSAKFFNFSYGGSFLVGTYTMYFLYREQTLPFASSIIISLLAAGLYSLLSYKLIFSSLLARRAQGQVILIASVGLLIATMAFVGMIFGNQSTLIARRLSDVSTIKFFGASLNLVQVVALIVIPIIIGILAYVRSKTRFGVAMRAIEDDREVAELVGVPKERFFLQIFFISGVLGGLWGIAEGFDLGVIPASGLIYILPTVVATVVGGMNSFWGGIIGAFILALAQEATVVLFGGAWVSAVPFVILIIALILRPEGIVKK